MILDRLPNVHDSDDDIRVYALRCRWPVPKVYVQLEGAISPRTPDVAVVNFDKPDRPVTRMKMRSLDSRHAGGTNGKA